MNRLLKRLWGFITAAAIAATLLPTVVSAQMAEKKDYTYIPIPTMSEDYLEKLIGDDTYDIPQNVELSAYDGNNAAKADWAIYIYMCGSNLESDSGCATDDIIEMLKATIPDNVKVMVLTGGAKNSWDPYGEGEEYNQEVGYDAYKKPDANYNQIYQIDDDKMTLVKTYDSYMYMSDAETAEAFINDAVTFAPAEHVMFEFWNHGGALFGAEQDDYSGTMLTIGKLKSSMQAVMAANGSKKIDILGFDTCLMSTLEIGHALSPYADYLIASEEIEPGDGWDYSFLNSFTDATTAKDIGKYIIDSYAYSLNQDGDWTKNTDSTLALTDLSKINDLNAAFDALASDMVKLLQEDRSALVKISRIAENTQSMAQPYGMIDLYDFAYKLQEIAPLAESAKHVIDVLGAPAGADSADYDGEVSPENYIGYTIGEAPAVLYRGTGYKFNNSVGLSIYYPIDSAALPASDVAQLYSSIGFSGPYTTYLTTVSILADVLPLFSGKITDEYDEENSLFSISIDPPEELDGIKRVDYITTYTEADENHKLKTYLLGSEMITEGWDENKFSQTPYDEWYCLDGAPITVSMDDYTDYTDVMGYSMYNYTIPAVLIEPDGTETMATLSCAKMVVEDMSILDEEDAVFENKLTVTEITPMTGGEVAQRTISPDADTKIKPVQAEYDMESGTVTGYKVFDKIIGLNYIGDDLYELPAERMPLKGSETTAYSSYFRVTDVQGNAYHSNPFDYFIADSFDEFKIGTIYPEVYTGKAVEPEIRLLFHGMETLDENDYEITYSNNVEKGTAYVTVTSKIADLPGQLTAEFTICDYENLAQECIKLLPGHEVLKGCTEAYEYIEHICVLEKAKAYYESGLTLNDEELARLNDQYEKYIGYTGASLCSNGVEIIGVFNACGYIQYTTTLVSRSSRPNTDNTLAALEKAKENAELIDCRSVWLYDANDAGTLEKVNIIDGSSVLLKIALPENIDTGRLKIYSLSEETGEPIPIDYRLVKRGGESYAVFDTDTLGYFALLLNNAFKMTVNGTAKPGENGTVTVGVDISNAMESSVNADIICAAYNNAGEMIGVTMMKNQAVNAGENHIDTVIENAEGYSEIKIFVWDNEMNPLAKAKEIKKQ